MIEITPSIQIDERELQFDFVRASGPGGQNVNKVATAVQLRFDVRGSSLPEDVKARLVKAGGKRVTSDETLVIEAKSFRTQEKNKEDAIARFAALVRRALERPKMRRKTRPTQRSREKRLEAKKKRGEIKKSRGGRIVE
ncbi:MAG: aminoacyl-tRNA hydrolase [Chloroflexi bacterium]|nr:aminoacyl-tRNA hydrolase [Chloroflexota bacterium]